jgi:hypothetical protein
LTVHVGLASPAGVVIVSDSQGSTATSEAHGLQKQVVGNDFIVGVAGAMSIVTGLLRQLEGLQPSGAAVLGVVENYTNHSLRPSAHGQFQVLAGTSAPLRVATFYPALFTAFGEPGEFGSIGSGAEFVGAALQQAHELGFSIAGAELVDLLTQALRLADAADRSLTVDDQLAVGIIRNGKAYALWDAGIRTVFVDPRLLPHSAHINATLDDLRARVETLSGELVNAVRVASSIWSGPLNAAGQTVLNLAAASIAHTKAGLQVELENFFAWYDGILGR